MFRCSIVFCTLLACQLITGTLECNKQSPDKDKPQGKKAETIYDHLSVFLTLVNAVCRAAEAEGNWKCNTTATLPAGVFTDSPVTVTIKFSGIELAKTENRSCENDVLDIVFISYRDCTITLEDSDNKVVINSFDNQFRVTVYEPEKENIDSSTEETCIFKWNSIQVEKFIFYMTSVGPQDRANLIAAKFGKKNLQELLNTTPVLDELNKLACIGPFLVEAFGQYLHGVYFEALNTE